MSSNNDVENLDIEIIYKNSKNIRLFGGEFVDNNKDKCKIIYKSKEYELNEYFNNIDNNYNGKDEIKIILRIKDIINNVSCMFYRCKTLLSFPDNYQLNSFSIKNKDVSTFNDKDEVFYKRNSL